MAEMPDRIGPYEIRGILGEGGMGQVLLAWDPALHREVALKRVTRQRDRVWRERFLREARALARIDDPHVVRVFACDAGEEPWLAMERLDGVDLRRHLRERGPVDPAVLRDACRQILTGLAAAHVAGILHRDLKPSNLLRCQGGVYKLIDFGLADEADHDLTDPDMVVGTERYLAPERLQGRPASPASDLWGLAVTMVELATGRGPSPGIPADPVLPGQPPEFTAWLRTCMAVQPSDRFADAGAALAALAGVPAPGQAAPRAGDQPTEILSSTVGPASATITATLRPPMATAVRPPDPIARPRWPFWIRLLATIWIIATAATLVSGWAIARHAIEMQTAQLRTQLMGVAALAAQRADPAAQARIASATAPSRADLDRETAALSAVRAVVPQIRAIYTMAREPGRSDAVRFVVDASPEIDTDGDGLIGRTESRAEPGEAYPAADMPDLWLGFDGPAADRAITSDTWGDHLSGYAPIRDAAGRTVAIVGVDLPAEQVAELRRRFVGHALVLAGSTLVAFLAAGLLVAWRMRRPVALLQRGMLAVAAGDLDQEVDIRSGDEFGVLAQAYRRMRDALRRAEEVRRAFDAFVARAAAERSGARPAVAGDDGVRLALLPAPGGDIAPLLAAVRDGGGAPERLAGEAVVALFPRRHAFDQPQERALRAALSGLAGDGGVAGVAVTADAAIALARVGRTTGADLLCAGEVYAPVATGFFADRLRLPGGGEAFAVKGPVSS